MDNLKVLLISAIIAIHGLLSYAGTLEVWTYSPLREVTLHPLTEAVLLVVITPFAFLAVPLLFVVAALLTPDSLRRKGARRFITDRLLRLGVPFLAFVFLLEPTLTYAMEHPFGDAPGTWAQEYLGAEKALDTGPMWFVGVLLIYSLVYAGWVAARGARPHRDRPVTFRQLMLLAAVVAVASFRPPRVYLRVAGRQDRFAVLGVARHRCRVWLGDRRAGPRLADAAAG